MECVRMMTTTHHLSAIYTSNLQHMDAAQPSLIADMILACSRLPQNLLQVPLPEKDSGIPIMILISAEMTKNIVHLKPISLQPTKIAVNSIL
jgi:hypothetical protein